MMRNQAGHQWENRYPTSMANCTSLHSTSHCEEHLGGGGGGRGKGCQKHGEKSTENENIWICLKFHSLQRPKKPTDLRPNALHGGVWLVLSRNSVQVCSLNYNGVKVPFLQQLCSTGACTESRGNWDHLLPCMRCSEPGLSEESPSHEVAIFCRC